MTIAGQPYSVRIARNRNARHLSMRVRDRAVRISAPRSVRIREIEEFLTTNIDWIDEQLQAERAAMPANDSATIYYHGVATRIIVARDAAHRGRGRIEHDAVGATLTIRINAGSRVRPLTVLEKLLRQEARAAIEAELAPVLAALGEAPTPVTIRDAKTRWGSCSTTRQLNFNWRLIMAPPESLRYVVVHEAAHLVHHDHSPRFWKLVGELMPGYKTHQRWLHDHQAALFADLSYLTAGI